jgi:spore coat polysaccharide biosynthesis protein SpsF
MVAKRRLVAALACRNQGSRLYGKPVQNLDVDQGVKVIDQIIDCIKTITCIDDCVLAVALGSENDIFEAVAKQHGISLIRGDEHDVLQRLIDAGESSGATDIFRVTTESPFMYFEAIESSWIRFVDGCYDALFFDQIVDGCGFEIVSLEALQKSHSLGESRHRSEMCTLYIRENTDAFRILRLNPADAMMRSDLRLTIDNPEDLVLCRHIFRKFLDLYPRMPLASIIEFLDKNPELKELVSPFTIGGYKTMYL